MRVPKCIYYDHFVTEFYTKNKERFFCISKWNESGTNLALISTGKYNDEDPKSLITDEIKSEQK